MKIEKILNEFKPIIENVIPILQEIQQQQQFVSKQDIEHVANYLQIKRSQVEAIIKFSKTIQLQKPGKHTITICMGPHCIQNGSLKLMKQIQQILEIQEGETSKDGIFTLKTTKCLQNCTSAPNISIDGVIYTRMDEKRIKEVLKQYRENGKEE